jgi:hypothetical protein
MQTKLHDKTAAESKRERKLSARPDSRLPRVSSSPPLVAPDEAYGLTHQMR